MLIPQKNIKLKGRPDGRPKTVEKVANRHLGETPSRGYPCPNTFSMPYIPESTAQLGRYSVFMFQ